MDIPIKGVLFESEGPNGQHSHRLYITSWDGRPVHFHSFAGVTSVNDGHSHNYFGVTAYAPTGVPHVHEYQTETSFNEGHTHFIRGVTSGSVELPDGGHFHYFEGVTTISGRHRHAHSYQGRTGNEQM